MICDLPSKVLSTLALNIPLYFMVNLHQDAGHFFIYLLFSFSSTLAMSSIFRTIGQSTRTIAQALTPAALFVIGLIVYTGFVLPVRDMQVWLRWINYINPLAYSYESLVANEFRGRSFPCASFIPSGPGYEDIKPTERTCSIPGAVAGIGVVSGDAYIAASYEYSYSHVWRYYTWVHDYLPFPACADFCYRNFGILIAYIVFFACVYVLCAEYLTVNTSQAEVLLFQRSQQPEMDSKLRLDEETPVELMPPRECHVAAGPASHAGPDKPMNIKKQTGVLHWKDLCYEVSIKGERRVISDHIDGWVRPGTLTALMVFSSPLLC